MNGTWAPYYTPKKIANDVLKYIPKKFTPEIVLDICAGSGNFLEASFNKKWIDTKYYAFDVISNESLKSSQWHFIKLNSLHINHLIKNVPLAKRKLILANPPFGISLKTIPCKKLNIHLESLFIAANETNRIETKMLLANISIMRDGDIFAAILPENIFSSETLSKFKAEFLSCFDVIKIGNPKKYFKGCEVRTRIFVGVFTKTNEPIKIKSAKPNNNQSSFQILRGIDNSKLSDVKNKNLKEVLHFNNPFGNLINRKYIELDKTSDDRIIQSNDLLIIRVGRHAGKVFKASPNFIGKLYSDYFFVVKNIRISKSACQQIETRLQTNIKGLTTNYLNKLDIEKALNHKSILK